MTQWWEAMSAFKQIMFVLASASTFVMIVFIILMLIGFDGSDSFDGDVDVDVDLPDGDEINDVPLVALSGLKILTIRGILAFIAVGCWTAFGLADSMNHVLGSFIGAIAGAIAAYLLAIAFRASLRLESEGNLNYKNAVGKIGIVYIKVPKSNTGVGKVNLTFQERYTEIDAITNETEDLKTGTPVEVVGLHSETTIIVKKVANEPKK